jgi:hypothetical protein
MRKIIAGPIFAGLIGMAALAAPLAAHAATTPTTFEVSAGTLGMTVPVSADLGPAAVSDTSVSGSLGLVSVIDNRGLDGGGWTDSVTATDFTTGGTGVADTISADQVTYDPGTITDSQNGTFIGTRGTLNNTTALSAVTASAEDGSASASWSPTITVALPTDLVAGTYSSVITQSVG